jgi:hypothetical protein
LGISQQTEDMRRRRSSEVGQTARARHHVERGIPSDTMSHPLDAIPELAGIATYTSAARVGFSVADNVERLLRYHWFERRLMAAMVARLPSMPVWEVKCALALHQWLSAEHVEVLRNRIAEMRSPVPNFETPPDDPALGAQLAAFDSLPWLDDYAWLSTVYGTLMPTLAGWYREHVHDTNPLVDHPTVRVLSAALHETDQSIAWGRSAIAALENIGGAQLQREKAPPESAMHPRRDARFHGQYNFEFPPHVAYNMDGVPDDERNLALLCKRTLEMDVPEMMASFMTERADVPWEFHRDYARQLWDEARHAMMGSVALEARGVDWKRDVPLNVSFALRLNLHATPVERQMMLFAIEQSLMPGETGKRFEYETAVAAGDALSAHFHDYDWADEVLHAQIGRRALKRDGITAGQASDAARDVHEKTWAALDRYRHLDSQDGSWWRSLVQRVLGRPSAMPG